MYLGPLLCLKAVTLKFTLKLLIGIVRQLIPINIVVYVQKHFCCIKPYTPPVLVALFFSNLKPFACSIPVYIKYSVS